MKMEQYEIPSFNLTLIITYLCGIVQVAKKCESKIKKDTRHNGVYWCLCRPAQRLFNNHVMHKGWVGLSDFHDVV